MFTGTRSCGSTLGVLFISLMAVGPARAAEPSFRGLGDLPGGAFGSRAFGMTADGSVVVGEATSASGKEGFRWTPGGGMVGLGDLPGGTYESIARDVSADGSVIVGRGRGANDRYEAFRWTAGGGMVGIGQPAPPAGFFSSAFGVSADGSVVVGEGDPTGGGGQTPYRWTVAGGATDLGGGGQGLAISADGNVLAGWHATPNGFEAFRWTQQGGFENLGDLPGGQFRSIPSDISADGSTVVGGSSSSRGSEAFRWRQGTGMVGLGFLPGHSESSALDVSADGSVVVGNSGGFLFNAQAYVWDPINGMQTLESILTSHGVNTSGWRLQYATGITPDGLTVVGIGTNPAGQEEAFIATIPEPGALSLLGLLGPLAGRRTRRRPTSHGGGR